MASLSLPRVLQLKKNSLDAEREQFEKFQTLAIQKAINSIETPVKEKHVRSTIIGTFQEQSAITYWMVASRLPLQDNRIVAWKFCHVTHKLLREGHPACLDDSQRHVAMIDNLGKLWVHLREGYGRLVSLYCALLVTKLKFHARNPRFPGSMNLSSDELDNIAENDVNNYFQICVELFDYMDDILNLQAAVFDSLGNARANSMTASGQCRLAALIPCAQDSSHLYDCNVRLLFRLHAALPADTLAGHRDRFRQQFKKLSSFYKHASSLQYYRNLLSLPVLPSSPPNFLLQSDFGTYVAPVVSVPQPTDEPDAALIDTSDTNTVISSPEWEVSEPSPSPSPQADPVVERDRLIEHLQSELQRMRGELAAAARDAGGLRLAAQRGANAMDLLQRAQSELEEERQRAQALSAETPEIKDKLAKVEEKAKVSDEKFQKLKGAYTQLREEHIKLIRQKAEVDKVSASLRAAAAEHESAKVALQQQLNDRMKDVELLQQSASSSEEIEAYKNEIASLRSDLEQSRLKEVQLETLKASMESLQIEHQTAAAEAEEKLSIASNELAELKQNLEKVKEEKEEREQELVKVRTELTGLRETSGEEYKKAVEEKEAALQQAAAVTEQFLREKQDLLQHNTELEDNLATLRKQLEDAQKELERNRAVIVSCAGSAALEVTQSAIKSLDHGNPQDNNMTSADLAAKAFEELAKNKEVKGNEEGVAAASFRAAHNTAQLSAYVTEVCNSSTDTELADKLTSECRVMLEKAQACLQSIVSGNIDPSLVEASRMIRGVSERSRAADGTSTSSKSVDDELNDMDAAIEQAAGQIEELLRASRAGDSGVKLEVNENILDACTTLMQAVKVLVQDARKLQQELGDPTTRANMYRRNPQWSEGLISAAKAVVFAAKLLVTSADEAVSSSARVEGVSAAAHEVAASSAQLVAASRARAPPAAPTLRQLAAASRAVGQAVAALVAAVRHAHTLTNEHSALDTSALTLTATRRLEMDSKVRALELETALEAERSKLAALRKRHYMLAQTEENGGVTNGNSNS